MWFPLLICVVLCVVLCGLIARGIEAFRCKNNNEVFATVFACLIVWGIIAVIYFLFCAPNPDKDVLTGVTIVAINQYALCYGEGSTYSGEQDTNRKPYN